MRLFMITLTIALLGTAVALASTSHDGWPPRTGTLKIAPNSDTHYVGTSRNDELLGGHGSDRLDGAGGDDVLWGDKNPSGQPESQHDTILGGAGSDFLYASHGRNTIRAGEGNDYVKAHWGRGSIDCGPGRDQLYVSHRAKPHYVIRHCETVSFKSLGF
jgi:hypothetical protein